MRRAEIYRNKALEWERMARTAADPAIRQGYLDLTYQWREIAQQAELMASVLPEPTANSRV